MKKFLLSLFTFGFFLTYAQTVSQYKYVYVPKTFEGKMDGFKLKDILAKTLTDKKYQVLREAPEERTGEFRDHPCSILTANLVDDSSWLRNKIELDFTDCKGNTVQKMNETSMEKDFETGFQEALHKALAKVNISEGKEEFVAAVPQTNENREAIAQKEPETEKISKPQEAVVNVVIEDVQEDENNSKTVEKQVVDVQKENAPETAVASAVERFSNGSVEVQKVNLGNGTFMLVSAQSSTPYATFTPSDKAGVYKVKKGNNEFGMGYEENGNLVIEIFGTGGQDSKEVFRKN